MAKLNQSYETIMILSSKLSEEERKAQVERFKELMLKSGTIDSEEEWGTRRLAYEINDETEGYYYLINFTSTPEFPAELDRRYKISDAVIRSLIVAKPELSNQAKKAAAAVAKKAAAAAAVAAAAAAVVAPVADGE